MTHQAAGWLVSWITRLARGCADLLRLRTIAAAGIAVFALPVLAHAAPLKAGAGKVEITPTGDQLPGNFLGVLDPIYARAIVVESDGQRAAFVTLDIGAVPNTLWENVSKRAAEELGIPVENIMITATHTHSVPFGGNWGYEDKVFEAITDAVESLEPAQVSYGTGVSYINVNRNIIDRKTNRWWEGPNYDGPSDKTVAVLAFETLDGEPIAVYFNYGVHAVLTGTLDMISGDLPGAAARYIEESLGGDAVALYSNGAAGDQNPIYFNQTYALRDIRIADYAARGEDISNAMPPGGQGMDRDNPRVALLMEQQKRMNLSMGQMLGEEVLRVLRGEMQRPVTEGAIAGAQTIISCPGRKRLDKGRAGYPGVYEDADPVEIRLSMIKIGDNVIGGVNGEVFTMIAQRFKRESPYKATMMTTLTNGMAWSGYIPSDAAFNQYTFEVVSSRLKPGCAETAIVNGLLDLTEQADGK